MKLFEQIDWDAVSNSEDVEDVLNVRTTVVTKPKDEPGAPPVVKLDPKIHNDDTQTTFGKQLAEHGELIGKLIINAIYFNREIAKQVKTLDIDENAVYRICTKRLSTAIKACYVDVILRLIYPNATMQKLIASNKDAYQYFFSRNYSTITLKSQKFQEIDPENSSNGFIIRGINQIFNSNTRPGNWFDWDSKQGIQVLNNLTGGSAAFKLASPANNKFILNMQFTDSQIHERVMAIWQEQIKLFKIKPIFIWVF